jgi:hypothetical protein
LQHFEIGFEGKTMQNSDFGNFETSPRCQCYRKFKIEHVVTEAMFQSRFVPSFIIIEAFRIVS